MRKFWEAFYYVYRKKKRKYNDRYSVRSNVIKFVVLLFEMCFASTIRIFSINIDCEDEILDSYNQWMNVIYLQVCRKIKFVNLIWKIQKSIETEINIILIIRGKNDSFKIPRIDDTSLVIVKIFKIYTIF